MDTAHNPLKGEQTLRQALLMLNRMFLMVIDISHKYAIYRK